MFSLQIPNGVNKADQANAAYQILSFGNEGDLLPQVVIYELYEVLALLTMA